jgi:hypothetical protein
MSDLQDVQKVLALPVSTLTKHEEIIPYLLKIILSAILNDLRKMAHLPAEDARYVIKIEVIPRRCNRRINFIICVKLAILQDFFQHIKEPKVVRAYVWRIEWAGQL